MTNITKNITVDLSRKSNARVVFARQNDRGSRTLNITLTDGGAPYFVPSGTVAVVNVLRPDGANASFGATVNEEGGVTYTLGLWSLTHEGTARCSVSLYGGSDRKLTSSDFYIDILDALYKDSDFSDDVDESIMTTLFSSVATLEEKHDREVAELEEKIELSATNLGVRLNSEVSRLSGSIGQLESNFAGLEGEVAETASELESKVNALYGASGEVTLLPADWSDDSKLTLKIAALGEHDMILFEPASATDRDLIADYEVFVAARATAGVVNISARSKPSEAISLCYFIVRGGV